LLPVVGALAGPAEGAPPASGAAGPQLPRVAVAESTSGGRTPSGNLESVLPKVALRPPTTAASAMSVPKTAVRRAASGGAATGGASAASSAALPPLLDVAEWARQAPAWLTSAILHILALLLLALVLVSQQPSRPFVLQLDPRDSGEALQPGDLDLPLEISETLLEANDLETAEALEIDASEMLAATEITRTSPIAWEKEASASPVRVALSGREEGMREALLKAYGGTGNTQESVIEALRWLARNQDRRSGLWSLTGPYQDGANGPENPDAATAMALLAFQGAGYTPAGNENEPFTAITRRGWTALLKRQESDGRFFQEGAAHDRLYTHAMGAIAICELYGMTEDSAYREPASRAIRYCVDSQAPEGGWRYTPGVDSDTSVTGWFVMALQSAQMAGLEVPSETLSRVSGYLDLVARDGGSRYAYVPSQTAKLSMSAEGLLCRQYLGWKHGDQRLQRGADLLVASLPSWDADARDVYYWYYAAQVCHHMEGRHWRTWNATMRRLLPEHQVRAGRERGSWDPQGDRWGGRGGRLFVTCLSTYMLEVYYRHLPIYRLDLLAR